MSNDIAPPRRARRRSGAVTLHAVAKLAGVAPITASRAINTPDLVSAEVLAKVRNAVEEAGYVPNLLAGGLASARSRLVAAVVPTVSGLVFLRTVQALTETLAENGYQLMLGQAGYGGDREDALLDAIIGRRPDGIVLTGTRHSAAARKRLALSGIPVVETWDLTADPIDMLVGFSHDAVGAQVAAFLAARGRRRFAVVAGDDDRAQRRHQAFAAATQAMGFESVPVITVPTPTTLRSGRQAFAALIEAGKAVDAVFCSSDLIAYGVMIEAQSLGIKIPDQLSVVGFGDLEFSADLQPSLTSVSINGAAIGQQAAQFIIERAENKTIANRIIDIGFSIISRESA